MLRSFRDAGIAIGPRKGEFVIQLPRRSRALEKEEEGEKRIREANGFCVVERRERGRGGGRWRDERFPVDLDVEVGIAYRKWRGSPRRSSSIWVDTGLGDESWWLGGLRRLLRGTGSSFS